MITKGRFYFSDLSCPESPWRQLSPVHHLSSGIQSQGVFSSWSRNDINNSSGEAVTPIHTQWGVFTIHWLEGTRVSVGTDVERKRWPCFPFYHTTQESPPPGAYAILVLVSRWVAFPAPIGCCLLPVVSRQHWVYLVADFQGRQG